MKPSRADSHYMRLALELARRGYGSTSPNPMVGAVLVKRGKIIGRGWHRRAGEPHAEIEALRSAQQHGHNPRQAILYVTLEPCSTQGRTPPCSAAIIAAGIRSLVVGATDPNPKHRGKAFELIRRAGITVTQGVLANDCERLNEAFNHWIVHHTPFVTVKAAMTLDGKIATAVGESKWITGGEARAYGMHLRHGADAVLVGINTILADDPNLTLRDLGFKGARSSTAVASIPPTAPISISSKGLRRIVLDAHARTPLTSKIANDSSAALTTIFVSEFAKRNRVKALAGRVKVCVAPAVEARPRRQSSSPGVRSRGTDMRERTFPLRLDLDWILRTLGAENVTSLLVEGGGEVNASFLMQGLAHRIAFCYAPRILGGRNAPTAVEGEGALLNDMLVARDLEWHRLGPDWLLSARVTGQPGKVKPS